jgi:ribosomal protein S6--L-glutamate ligase
VLVGRIASPEADTDLQLDAVRALELLDIPCLNRVGPMLAAQDKLWTGVVLAKAGVPTPLCTSVPTREDVTRAAAEIGDWVAKPVVGSLGEGVFRSKEPRSRERLAASVIQEPWLLQRFVPPGGTDYRLFVVGDRVEACIRREAPEGDWRTNIARGSTAAEMVPHRLWSDIAVEAARALQLDLAGVDLAVSTDGPTVLEVNGWPSFQGIYRATGRDMAEAIARQLHRHARGLRRRPARRLRA